MPKQSLLLFGFPQVTVDGAAVDIKSRKGLALLAYLAVTRIPQSRDTLVGLLWPEYNQTRARANLRRTLFNLNRTVVADWLVADGQMLELRNDVLAGVDVVRFEEFMAGGAVDELETATRLYRDDFFAGYHLPDSEPFDEWAMGQRARLRRQMLDALDKLAQHHLEQSAWEQAVAVARRQLTLDDLRESAWRQLMAGLARAGERNEALAEYAHCRKTLADELGIEPAEATTALFLSIRGGDAEDVHETVAGTPPPTPVAEDQLPDTPLPASGSPYRGLFAFREDDAELFYGREELTELLVGHVHTEPIVAVIGPSGSGKTSVVYAGLVAQLRTLEDWAIASFRPGMDPFQALAAALIPMLAVEASPVDKLVEARKLATALRDGVLSLQEIVGQIRQQGQFERLLLVADQFEELYTLCTDVGLHQLFLDTLLDLVFSQQYLPDPIFSLVLTLRADFLGQALSDRAFADAIQESDVKLGPMTRPELTRAIVKPAERRGAHFEPGLVTRMLDDVGDEPGNLPLLEFALDSLWSLQQAALLRHETYEAIGRVEGALARYADEVYASLDEDEQIGARRLFTQLVQPGEGTEDTRRVATHRDLGDEGWALASILADARLVITGIDADEEQTAEVVHEALIRSWGRLRAWMAEDREFRVWQERLRASERQWQINDRDEGSLLRGASLSTAEAWLASRPADVGETEKDFIQASIELRERRQEEADAAARSFASVQRRLVYTLTVGLLLALLLAAVAGLQWRTANRERQTVEAQSRVALSRQLAAQSGTVLERGAFDLAHLLAIEAVQLDANPDSLAALRAAVDQPNQLMQTFTGHEGLVISANWNPDESRVVTSSFDGTARVWDANTGEQLLVLEGHDDKLTDVAEALWSPDGARVLTVGDDETIRIWDASTGIVQHVLHAGHADTWAEWSPDGERIFGVGDSLGKIWDAETVRLLTILTGHENFIQQGHWNNDGSRVITNSADRTARVWDAESGEQLLLLAGHDDGVIRARWSPDESRIMTAGIDGVAKVWDAESGAELLTLAGHTGYLWEARWNGDGTRILTTSGDGDVKIWDANSGALLQTLSGHESLVEDAVWSADERMVATAGGDDGTARIWDAATGEEVARFGHDNFVKTVRWRNDDRAILTAGGEGVARLWAVGPQSEASYLPELRGSPSEYNAGVWSRDDRLILSASSDPQGTVILWDSLTGEITHNFSDFGEDANSARWRPDEEQVIAGGSDGEIFVWDAATGALQFELSGQFGAVFEAIWDAQARRILTAGYAARIWDAETGAALVVYTGHKFGMRAAIWNPDNRRVATVSEDGAAHIWDSQTGETLFILDPNDGDGRRIAWNPAGDRLAAGGESGVVRVWDAQSGELLLELLGHSDLSASNSIHVSSVIWNGDGSRLLTTVGDAARIWDAESGELLETLAGEGETIYVGAWNSDDSRIALAIDTVGIQVWDAENGRLLEQIPDVRLIKQVQWSHDGRRLAAIGQAGIRQYLVDTNALIEIACQRAGRGLSEEEWAQYLGKQPYIGACEER